MHTKLTFAYKYKNLHTNTNIYIQIQTFTYKYKHLHTNTNICIQIQKITYKSKDLHTNNQQLHSILTFKVCKKDPLHRNTNLYTGTIKHIKLDKVKRKHVQQSII